MRVTPVPGFADMEASLQLTPCAVGAEQLSVTGLLKPPVPLTATVKVATPPGATDAVDGDGVTAKSDTTLKVAPTV